jgi:hypothetical protein
MSFEYGKNRQEKIDKFLDNLAWHFSTKVFGDPTATQVERLTERLDTLNENFRKADESSIKLTRALNMITFWGVLVASTGVAVAFLNFIFQYIIKK